jgi:DNA-binding XRE family transcriptional regulator
MGSTIGGRLFTGVRWLLCSRSSAFGLGRWRQGTKVPDRELATPPFGSRQKSTLSGTFSLNFLGSELNIPAREHGGFMDANDSGVGHRASEAASDFGAMIRSRRKALRMRQDQLALATGVGRRFLIDLEAGKPSCQLGRSLLVANALGLGLSGPTIDASGSDPSELPDLPEVGG